MRNIIKWFGIIALGAVIVFSMAGCDTRKSEITVKNASSVTIYQVYIHNFEPSQDVMIQSGASKTFTSSPDFGSTSEVIVRFALQDSPLFRDQHKNTSKALVIGENLTVTITEDDFY